MIDAWIRCPACGEEDDVALGATHEHVFAECDHCGTRIQWYLGDIERWPDP